uniref:AAA_6 domain-containing protein n=1 Tax=Steinernema glaseri TaxID=37863 RepID=A0A1I8A9E9_9BILA
SLPSQRLAFQIAANCALYVSVNDFNHVKDSLADLTQRFGMDDKRSLESVCLLFSRLVDNLKGYPDKLREIAGEDFIFLKNIQQL